MFAVYLGEMARDKVVHCRFAGVLLGVLSMLWCIFANRNADYDMISVLFLYPACFDSHRRMDVFAVLHMNPSCAWPGDLASR